MALEHVVVHVPREPQWHMDAWIWWAEPRCKCGAKGSIKAKTTPLMEEGVEEWFEGHLAQVAGAPPKPVGA